LGVTSTAKNTNNQSPYSHRVSKKGKQTIKIPLSKCKIKFQSTLMISLKRVKVTKSTTKMTRSKELIGLRILKTQPKAVGKLSFKRFRVSRNSIR
jgi:hypothetical protein